MSKIYKYRNLIILTIGTLLIILSLCLLFYDKIELLKSNVFDEIEMGKYRESNTNVDNNGKNALIEDSNLTVDNISIDEVDNTNVTPVKESTKNTIKKEFIGYLEIKKINLKQGLVSKKSYYNNVNLNIQILSESSYPDEEKGNVILASHSGTSSVSYFKNLYKLSINDEAKIYYKGSVYTYYIVDIYNVPKVGKVTIKRNVDRTCLTLITCTKNDKTKQTVYILELENVTKDGG